MSAGERLDFAAALRELHWGAAVARVGWNGRNMWVAISPGFRLKPDQVFSPAIRAYLEQLDDQEGVFQPYLMLKTADDRFVPWVASHSDLLAQDWEVVREGVTG